MYKKLTIDDFILKSQNLYGDKYDYSKVEYKNTKTKVCITCSIHGEFWRSPKEFLSGNRGCGKCSGRGLNNYDWIERFKHIHGDKYNYENFDYGGALNKSCIICTEHGEFWITPANHMCGKGCRKCRNICIGNRFRSTLETFKQKATETHNSKYDYSNVQYVNSKTLISIICLIHGEFKQTPYKHLSGQGCPECGKTKIWDVRGRTTAIKFVEKAMEIHGDKYDYSKVIYEASQKKICIICPVHGEFWQTPNKHLQGQKCPQCRESCLEEETLKFLDLNNIVYERQKGFEWLKYKKSLFLDFYLPDYNIAIECQGGQHFEAIGFYGGEKSFDVTKKRDEQKFALCQKNGIKMLYMVNEQKYKDETHFMVDELYEQIKNGG